MKKRLKSLGIPALVMFALAVVLLGGGVVGSTRAAVSYVSKEYSSTIEVPSIGVTLLENGQDVGYRNYNEDAAVEADKTASAENYNDESYKGWNIKADNLLSGVKLISSETTKDENTDGIYSIGQEIPEVLTVKNSGTIDTYVRAIVYHYWTDSKGNKMQALDPGKIILDFNDGDWVIDDSASTAERTVLYYNKPLGPEEKTPAFLESVKIDDTVKTAEEKVEVDSSITTYTYNGMKFNLEAAVEAVQAENGAAAIKSAWGIDADWANDGDGTGTVDESEPTE